MNPEIKHAWLRNLRSGEYKKGKAYLRREEPDGIKFCCLGVLCDMFLQSPEGRASGAAFQTNEIGLSHFKIGITRHDGYLPPVVQRWAGLTCMNPCNLARVNDSTETFDDVIAIIEREDLNA